MLVEIVLQDEPCPLLMFMFISLGKKDSAAIRTAASQIPQNSQHLTTASKSIGQEPAVPVALPDADNGESSQLAGLHRALNERTALPNSETSPTADFDVGSWNDEEVIVIVDVRDMRMSD